MKVLLISANTERLNMPALPLGLGYVAAAARAAGHEVRFLDLLLEADPVRAVGRAIEGFAPEAIGISVRNIDDQELSAPTFLLEKARAVVAACRDASAAPVVLGGAGYSIFPDEVLEYLGADLGVHGDGEQTFPALLDLLARGVAPDDLPGVHVAGRSSGRPCHGAGGSSDEIAGLSGASTSTSTTAGPGRRNRSPRDFPDLGPLPLPDDAFWERVDPSTLDLWVPVQTRRGCANDCSYCSTAFIQGRRIRTRPPGEVVEHVARLARAGFGRFYFVDNVFNLPEPHAFELCRLLRELKPRVSWRCILYPHKVRAELVRAMAEAGCVEVALGFESGAEPVLHEMNKRFTPGEVRVLSDLLATHGIRRMGFLLLGGPGETRETVAESLDFAQTLRLDLLRVTVGIRIYPGTPLARRALADGVIAPDDDLLRPRFYMAEGLEPYIRALVTPGIMRP